MNREYLKDAGYEVIKIKLNSINDIKEFVEKANCYKTKMYVTKNEYCIDAKSIMGILSLNLDDNGVELWFEKMFMLTTAEDFKQWVV